jgi:hypothetical protein
MTSSRLAQLVLLGFTTLAAACAAGPTGPDDPDDPIVGGGPDAGPGETPEGTAVPAAESCEANGYPKAAVVTVNGDSDEVWVMTLDGGELQDNGLRFPGINVPRAVAMNPNGTEAMVAWGGFGKDFGIAVFEFANDGSTAELTDKQVLGAGATPFGLAYASEDRAVLATAGSNAHDIIALDRDGDKFVAGEKTPVPDEWPLELESRPGFDEVVLTRAKLTEDVATDFYRLTRAAETWIPSSSTVISPRVLDVAVHASGTVALSPSSDPANPMTSENLDVPGFVQIIDIDGMTRKSFAVPHRANLIATSPRGDYAVLASPSFEIDPNTGTPVSRETRLQTISTDADGQPTDALGLSAPFTALLIDDMRIASNGVLLVSSSEYPNTTPADESRPLRVWQQASPGEWQECETHFIPGTAKIALAP